MVEAQSRPVHASVVYLRIPQFSRRLATERAELKIRLDRVVAAASAIFSGKEADRIFLDAPDGAAAVVLGNPSGAFEFANESVLLSAAKGLPIGIGVDHGPVSIDRGHGALALLIGDALSVASTAADFAPAGRILASRSFRDYLVRLTPERCASFAPAGSFSDREHRAHEFYFADRQARLARRRRLFAHGALGAAGVLALGLFGRTLVRKPAVVELEVKPSGEVYVDGVLKGKAPPLTRLELAPGKHRIELRHPRFKSFVTELDVKAGEQITLKHSFTDSKGGFFDWLRR